MKLGILTLTPKHNYGGILQAVALYGYLKSRGYEVTLINKVVYRPLWKRALFWALETLPVQNVRNIRYEKRKELAFDAFIKRNITDISPKIVSRKDLNNLIAHRSIDCVLVGSDQVWRHKYINDGHHSLYFLDVDVPVRKISYAASFGLDYWEAPSEVEEVAKLLKDFHAISVRETSGLEICRSQFDILEAQLVLDPTLLVGQEFYEPFISCVRREDKVKIVAVYIIDESDLTKRAIDEAVKRLPGNEADWEVVNLAGPRSSRIYQVEEWLWYIKHANYVITDSFHGTAFSILFNKRFVALANEDRGVARFKSLLSLFGLQSRLLLKSQGMHIDLSAIELPNVNETLQECREKSIFFLEKHLS